MEDKLQRLTQKLYEEGLSKGRNEADDLVKKAKEEAAAIVKEAKEKAGEILREAERNAQDMKKNTETEVALASRQVISTLKQNIENLILTKEISPAISDAVKDESFVKELILAVAGKWNGAEGNRTDLSVLIPSSASEKLEKELKEAAGKAFSGGLDVVRDDNVKTGFRIGPKNGGYYISFSDADFDALFREYLRPKVAELLYGEK